VARKKNEIDARNLLGFWSLIKWLGDIAIIVVGGGILAHMPDIVIFSLVFILWLWSLIKMIADTPLVILWSIGKVQHLRRRYKRKKKGKKK